jgi:hypothetical protein
MMHMNVESCHELIHMMMLGASNDDQPQISTHHYEGVHLAYVLLLNEEKVARLAVLQGF